jgi:polyphosphate glucokinase
MNDDQMRHDDATQDLTHDDHGTAVQAIPIAEAAPVAGPLTLAIDVGGTRLKAGVLEPGGKMVIGPVRTDTPKPATPAAVLSALEGIIAGIGEYHRISVGFPGVVRHGRVFTAPNLGTDAWRAFPLVAELQQRLGRPARLLNDATVQGLGVVEGHGLECILTLGTGMGFALFQDGMPAPQLELGQHIARKRVTYDHYVGNAAYEAIGPRRWNRRLLKVLAAIDELVNYDALLIGGGNAKHIAFDLPPRVRLVSNQAGITGGVKLWDPSMDDAFVFRMSDASARRGPD